jgi:putative PIN family toxin of toxin-antitoxin system
MKLIFDTNVLIAAFATHGICHSLFEYSIENSTIVISKYIIDELQEKFLTKFKMPEEKVIKIVSFLNDTCLISDHREFSKQVSRDAKDDPILGIIDLQMVNYLVTGDKDLLILKEYKTVPIISPRELWNIFRED